MRVYAFKGNSKGFMEIENTLEAEQAFVGGLIEKVALTERIDLICNEEFLLQGLEPRVAMDLGGELPQIICGDCFICRHDGRGNFVSIREEDLEIIAKKIIHLDTPLSKLLAVITIAV